MALPAARTGYKILVAEDHPVNRVLARKLLEKRGHQVALASDGGEAVRLWRDSPEAFDAILMDIQMPGVDGVEAARQIRSLEPVGRRRIPIIAFTAHAMEGDEERYLAAGMDDYVSKPVEPCLLFEALERLCAPQVA